MSPLPTAVPVPVIRYVFVAPTFPNKAVKALVEREVVAEVLAAVNRWAYEGA